MLFNSDIIWKWSKPMELCSSNLSIQINDAHSDGFARWSNNLIHQIEVNCNGPWFEWTKKRRKKPLSKLKRNKCILYRLTAFLPCRLWSGPFSNLSVANHWEGIKFRSRVFIRQSAFTWYFREEKFERKCHSAAILLRWLSKRLHCLCLQKITYRRLFNGTQQIGCLGNEAL